MSAAENEDMTDEIDRKRDEEYDALLRSQIAWDDKNVVTIDVGHFVPEGTKFWHAISPGLEPPHWELVCDIYEREPEIVIFQFDMDKIIDAIDENWYVKETALELRQKFVDAIAKIDSIDWKEWGDDAEA